MIIGLTGPMGSGKTTVLDVLIKLGYKFVTLSDMVREEAQNLGIKEERENLMNIGQSLRHKFGPGVLAFRALEKVKEWLEKVKEELVNEGFTQVTTECG